MAESKKLIERYDPKTLEEAKGEMIKKCEKESLDAYMRASYAKSAIPDIENVIAGLQVSMAEVDEEIRKIESGDMKSKQIYEAKKGLKEKRMALEREIERHKTALTKMQSAAQLARSQGSEALGRADFIRANFPEKILAEASAIEVAADAIEEDQSEKVEEQAPAPATA